jgi:hemolysin III
LSHVSKISPQIGGISYIVIVVPSIKTSRGDDDNRLMYYGERFNGYTHLAGTVLAAAGATILVGMASMKADPTQITSFSVYGATLCLVFLASTLYHSTQGPAKRLFQKLDHCSIYLVIAGTYTPFAMVSNNGVWGNTLFAAIWSLAAVGIAQEIYIAKGARLTSLAIYLIMGWLALVDLVPLVEALTWNGIAWVAGGGLVYTSGIVFYLFDDRFPHWHGIWHLFVLGGAGAHYAAILKFVA